MHMLHSYYFYIINMYVGVAKRLKNLHFTSIRSRQQHPEFVALTYKDNDDDDDDDDDDDVDSILARTATVGRFFLYSNHEDPQ